MTLYSGQFVAQSEFSVGTRLTPDSGSPAGYRVRQQEAGARRDQPADNGIFLQAPQQRGVAGLLDLDLAQHLPHDHLDLVVVDLKAPPARGFALCRRSDAIVELPRGPMAVAFS